MKMHVSVMSAIALLIALVAADKIDSQIPCAETANCTNIPTLPPETVCQEGYCMCPNDKLILIRCSGSQAAIHEIKTPGPLVYRRCKHDQDCNLQGGFCNTTNQQCECSKGYVPSNDKRHCLQKAQSMNFTCTEDNQCLAFLRNTTCRSNKCACVSGYHYVDQACWRTAGIDGECANNYECYQTEDYKSDPPIKSLICEANKCTCAENYTRAENVCVNGGSLIFASFPVIALIALICTNL